MGLLKKIFKPVRKVLDKVIPNEIKPALPFLAAFTPFLAPTSGIFGSMAGRAALSGGANIFAQLAQEGTTEDDLNLLSAGIAAATGALSAPGAGDKLSGMTTAGKLKGAPPGMADRVLSNRNILQKGIDLGLTGASKAADFLSVAEGSGGVGDIIRPGGTKLGLDMASATAVGVPLAQGTGDAMYTDAVIAQKQQIIDDALAAAELLEDSGARAQAIRNAMSAYGFFTDEEIEDTISSAGYKAGGRVGLESGGGLGASARRMQGRKGESENLDLMTIKSTLNQVYTNNDDGERGGYEAVMKFMEKNPEYKVEVLENIIGDEGNKIMVAPINKESVNILDQDGIKTITVGDGIELIMPEKKAKGGRIGAEEGGLMNLGGKEMDLRGGGFVPIGKKERADDVPARLSKNEFVMTADAVRAAGGGSVNKGAKRMYDLMNNLEARV